MAFRNDTIAQDAVAITPSDTAYVDLIGLYVGGTGNVVVTTGAGNDVTFSAVPVGARIDLKIVRVKSTSTTATLLVGFKA